ncbi:MAG: hypothetical protein OJF49_002308 [Ktedonobacterales bacterium]|nr:MAG: hypothetical protein OJF49_002308 [Ktedonobacterales bacterium]
MGGSAPYLQETIPGHMNNVNINFNFFNILIKIIDICHARRLPDRPISRRTLVRRAFRIGAKAREKG